MTVAELQDILDHYRSDLPVVIEIKGIGQHHRSEVVEIDKALYEGAEEVHLIGTPVQEPAT